MPQALRPHRPKPGSRISTAAGTVTVVVSGGLGASLGLYGRLLTEHWKKHIPGNPNVILQSRPGGGGTKGAAYIYNAAPKDGTFVAEVLAPSVLAPTLRGSKFRCAEIPVARLDHPAAVRGLGLACRAGHHPGRGEEEDGHHGLDRTRGPRPT